MAQSVGTTHNDGGFFREFVDLVSSGSKNIVVECPSQQKLEAIVIHALKGIKEDKLKKKNTNTNNAHDVGIFTSRV